MASITPFFKAFGPLLFGRPAARQAAAKLRRRASSLQDLYELFGYLFNEKLLDCTEEGANSRERVFSPKVTFWAFVAQVLSPESPCRETVRRVEAWWRRQVPTLSTRLWDNGVSQQILTDYDHSVLSSVDPSGRV